MFSSTEYKQYTLFFLQFSTNILYASFTKRFTPRASHSPCTAV